MTRLSFANCPPSVRAYARPRASVCYSRDKYFPLQSHVPLILQSRENFSINIARLIARVKLSYKAKKKKKKKLNIPRVLLPQVEIDAILALNRDLSQKMMAPPPQMMNNHMLASKTRVRIVR